VTSVPACTLDFFPTALELAGANPAAATKLPLDGVSILPLLTGSPMNPDRTMLFFDSVYLQTARFGKWKIHVSRWRVNAKLPGEPPEVFIHR
jgi:hypothetical protein